MHQRALELGGNSKKPCCTLCLLLIIRLVSTGAALRPCAASEFRPGVPSGSMIALSRPVPAVRGTSCWLASCSINSENP